jgi:O-antigen biosynthesis protein
MPSVVTVISSLLKRSLSSTHRFGSAVALVSNLYPHPSASAAGVRTSFMLDRFTKDPSIERVYFLTGATPNDAIEKSYPEVTFFHMPPNDTPGIESVLEKIGTDLSIVIFDRFYAEEAYSFHFRRHCPDAIRVVDMQDMHSLRLGRQRVILDTHDEDSADEDPFNRLDESIQYEPPAQDEKLQRELASLHRSDLVMVCSPHEIVLLTKFGLRSDKIIAASFWVDSTKAAQPTTFGSRNNFVFLGGFKHPPNVDGVKVLAEYIWPRIHQRLPESSLNIYGAFCPSHLMSKFNSSPNLYVHGFAPSLEDILTQHRVMLAPIRFGAGIKGKIVDAWRFGLPVVSTDIGAEGMNSADGDWGGKIANTVNGYVEAAVNMYSDSPDWANASRRGTKLLHELFSVTQWDHVMTKLKHALEYRDSLRSKDYQGAILWHQTARSTEFFSRWIECKNKNTTRNGQT